MNRLVPALICAALSACVSQFESMDKGGPTGDHYTYHYGQIGGKGTAQSSMGTAVAFDGEKSLADVIQGVVAVKGFSAATAQSLHKEVTARYKAGQVTLQQKQAYDAAIAQSGTSAELQIALANIAKGH